MTAGGAGVAIADALAAAGWAVVPGFLEADLVAALRAELERHDAAGGLRPAGIGAGPRRTVRPGIRGDRIRWVEPPLAPAEAAALARFEALRVALNRELQLGLHELEVHYALYPPGAGYARHLDRSPAGAERAVSVVAYLNADWRPEHGGRLRLFPPDGEVAVEPRGGTLATFLSERLEHEVEPAGAVRASLAGWFRRRPLSGPARGTGP